MGFRHASRFYGQLPRGMSRQCGQGIVVCEDCCRSCTKLEEVRHEHRTWTIQILIQIDMKYTKHFTSCASSCFVNKQQGLRIAVGTYSCYICIIYVLARSTEYWMNKLECQ